MVCDLSYLEDREEKAHGLTESISDESVYRTAPATPGVLTSSALVACSKYLCQYFKVSE